jgi:hypothetical protein
MFGLLGNLGWANAGGALIMIGGSMVHQTTGWAAMSSATTGWTAPIGAALCLAGLLLVRGTLGRAVFVTVEAR